MSFQEGVGKADPNDGIMMLVASSLLNGAVRYPRARKVSTVHMEVQRRVGTVTMLPQPCGETIDANDNALAEAA